ncbi:MAG: hypothetical protein H0W62_12440 [Chitinophagales bacterium]|nr:hypothetical protein [Chitinophagales bacterium]
MAGRKNGELLLLLSKNRFDIFITIDTNLVYQQNLKRYSIIIAVIEVTTTDIETLIPIAKKMNKRIKSLQHGRIYRF